VKTEKSSLEAVRSALIDAGIPVARADLAKLPKNKKIVSGRDAEVLMNLTEAIDEHDDVQKVYSEFELSDEAFQKLANA
jgi:transcriptional/translational regulatory protein YebC/TACO1